MKTNCFCVTPNPVPRHRAGRKRRIRIVVADDHPIVREGIVANLSQQQDMNVVAEGNDGVEALELIKEHTPDVVVLDLQMPRMDGLAVAFEIAALRLDTKVIVMTTFDNQEDIQRSMKAGAHAYLLKDCSRQILFEAVRHAYLGKVYLLPHIAQKLVDRLQAPPLSPRELEVLELVASGESNKEIGSELCISEGTVKTHVASVLVKLGVATRTNAVREAARRGLVKMS